MAEPIATACPKCTKAMKVPAQFAGKKIRCKACANVFLVEAPKSAGEDIVPIMKEDAPRPKARKPAAKPTGPAVKPAPPPKPARKDDDDDDDGSKTYGYEETELGHRCPECANELEDEDAIICLNCGYNTVTRTRPHVKKLLAHTAGDWFLWLTPPILCILSVFILLAFDIWYCLTFDSVALKDAWFLGFLPGWFIAHGGIKLWIVIMSLGAMFFAGRFGLKRLILHPRPPEKIKSR